MAHRIPMAPPPNDDSLVLKETAPTHVGERAADQATALYIEEEHKSRRERFEQQLKRAEVRD